MRTGVDGVCFFVSLGLVYWWPKFYLRSELRLVSSSKVTSVQQSVVH